ncbi:GTPase family protein [Raineyella sp. W15-4]|uniref:GTPase family protein n=1 Tax=Raineyella sp. W15-4 TaxID=3081651 RepID=UPI002953B236|nr:GTPase [Raineyella sp. W15-4]WOQ16239.1 GTPase [Raineyella sp. W15-4]
MPDWFTDAFRTEYERQLELLGRFNLALFGKTGVGKSTLVNAVFGAPVAATGIGEPVTRDSHLYLDDRGQLGLLDTRGLEIGRDDRQLLKELESYVRRMRREPVEAQIHVVWYCVRGMDRRFEPFEAEFVRRLDALDLPVIMVLTQVPRDAAGRLHPDAVALAQHITDLGLPIVDGHPYLTYALEDPFSGQSSYGLTALLEATFRGAPAAVHAALTAAQQIDHRRKAAQARRFIAGTAAGAAATGATPIPFSDATVLVPLQLAMMARISQLYQVPVDRAALMAVASTTVATQAGRASVTGLLKLIPGAGSVAGGAIGAAVASSFTYAMGEAWLAVVERAAAGALRRLDGVLDPDQVRSVFLTELRRRVPGLREP